MGSAPVDERRGGRREHRGHRRRDRGGRPQGWRWRGGALGQRHGPGLELEHRPQLHGVHVLATRRAALLFSCCSTTDACGWSDEDERREQLRHSRSAAHTSTLCCVFI